jgi:prolyl oligopeptidase
MAKPVPSPLDRDSDIVVDVLHGVRIADPFRWLEDQNSPRTRAWLREQATHTEAYLAAIPGRDALRQRVRQLLAAQTISDPLKVGNRFFHLGRLSESEQPTILMREEHSETDIVLVDPNKRDETGKTAVGILTLSNDGGLLAYSIRTGGTDGCSVEFLDVARRKPLTDYLPHGFCRGLVFASDRSGFYYSHESAVSPFDRRHGVFWHSFGTDSHHDAEIFAIPEEPNVWLTLLASPSGNRLGYYRFSVSDSRRIDFWIHNIGHRTAPQLIIERMPGVFCPILQEERLFALTDWNAPNCRVVEINENLPEPRAWRQIIPESDSWITAIAVVSDHIVVSTVKDIGTRIEVFDLSGTKLYELPLPFQGTATLVPCRSETDTIFVQSSSLSDPPAMLCHNFHTRKQTTWPGRPTALDLPCLEVRHKAYPSRDGTSIPISLVSRRDLDTTRPLPTFLTAYGGFGNSMTPRFTAHATYLLERSCLFAVANIRGGAEFGAAWHLAARRQNRQVAIDDFLAGAEWLLGNGYTDPGRLAIGGGSNAGLLVASAFTQKPHLFRAVVCLGPLLDMLRYHRFDFASRWIDEYGSAERETDFRALLAYSPYHAVENEVSYPAVLFISGDADTRCNPMHTRKMTAKLQLATSSEHPILLEYRLAWGHQPVQPLTTKVEALTNRLAFLCHELGIDEDRGVTSWTRS